MVDNIENVSIENSNSISLERHKIVFIGDVSVGKTSILTRFLDNKYKDSYEPSIGVDFNSKNIKHKGKSFKLQIWDSAGQERYKSLIPTYIRGSSIIFVVYDCSRRETFDSVMNWINFVKGIENPLIVLLANKLDLQRKVETSEGEKLAGKEGLLFFEVSAKTNLNIKKAFFTSIAELPIFEKTNSGSKQKLIEELENENDSKLDSMIMDPVNNGLNIINSKSPQSNSSSQVKRFENCKC